ncbi:AlpA family transcriptional regulator [Desulfobulbus sp.]|uniref:helix-turn-helix transcriptional regulator n=1 Tax=Desulfobulbus sp. TaxID=895 RepID=UPI0027BAE35F|nr:hypothetical protein [Desulfobulbus sp.]
MVSINNDTERYILLSDVADKCISLAEKWNYITHKKKIKNLNLEDELIKRAFEQQLHLYCFVPVVPALPGLGKKWFFIWSDNLKYFSSPQNSIECNIFLVSSKDRIKFDRNYDSEPRLMEVRRSDLYLSLDELKRLEENGEDFENLVIVEHNLAVGEVKIEIGSTPEEKNISKPMDSRKETSNMPAIDGIYLPPIIDDSSLASSYGPDLEVVLTVENQPPLASEIEQESHSMAQTEKPKRTKQPNKKKEKTLPLNFDTVVEKAVPNPLGRDDREPLPLKTLADLHMRNLSLEDIIGNREKGIPAIIPVGKSTWYAGVKSGRYPKPFEVSEGRVAWRGSDIYALLQNKGMV